MKRPLVVAVCVLALAWVAVPGSAAAPAGLADGFGQARLTAFASLPAETFVPASEPSGAAIGTAPINGIVPPFADPD